MVEVGGRTRASPFYEVGRAFFYAVDVRKTPQSSQILAKRVRLCNISKLDFDGENNVEGTQSLLGLTVFAQTHLSRSSFTPAQKVHFAFMFAPFSRR